MEFRKCTLFRYNIDSIQDCRHCFHVNVLNIMCRKSHFTSNQLPSLLYHQSYSFGGIGIWIDRRVNLAITNCVECKQITESLKRSNYYCKYKEQTGTTYLTFCFFCSLQVCLLKGIKTFLYWKSGLIIVSWPCQGRNKNSQQYKNQ